MRRQKNYTSGRDGPSRRRPERRVGGIGGEPESVLPSFFIIIAMGQVVIDSSNMDSLCIATILA
jgi:hypothetical protein